MLTVLVSSISNSEVVLLKTCEYLLQMQAIHIFGAKLSVYIPDLMIKVLMIHLLMTSLVLNT